MSAQILRTCTRMSEILHLLENLERLELSMMQSVLKHSLDAALRNDLPTHLAGIMMLDPGSRISSVSSTLRNIPLNFLA